MENHSIVSETNTPGGFAELGVSPQMQDRLQRLGIESPFPIQASAIPVALEGRDIFGQAQTGSGKTLAFAIPIVERSENKGKNPFALIMVPTRELAAQVTQVFKDIGGDLVIMSAFGGTPVNKDIQRLEQGIDVLVATPGRLADLYERHALHLDDVRVLVLDEADRMLDLGFMYDMDWLIRRLPKERQTMLFSATLLPTVRQLARRYTTDPVHVEIEGAQLTIDEAEHRFFMVHPMDKLEVLFTLLESKQMTIIFTSTKRFAARLEDELRKRKVQVSALHGDMSQTSRTKALARFTEGRSKVLVASDVAARGLDVTGIEQVVNYDPPEDPTVYLHRTGRTARAGAAGLAITLCTAQERGHVEHMIRRLGLKEKIEEVFSTSPVLKEVAS
jgi:ATP-dependent RNA helicase DeaD